VWIDPPDAFAVLVLGHGAGAGMRSPFMAGFAEAIGRLAPDQRAVIVLRYLLEHTPGEIAQMLDLPRGTVNSRLRRALDELAGEVGT
jgi:RNA polymerase sigma factor (sigma-70 family)